MLKKLQTKREEGFTIIEVLIVLAIAGLILLIVFLAVPALQRNSRNTAIKNDAANVVGAMSDSVSNSNGAMPTNVTCVVATGIVTVANTAATEGKVRGGTACTFNAGNGSAVSIVTPTATGTIATGTNHGCNTAANGAVAKNRAIAALFLVETGASTTALQCVES
jgi:prepilin-type N-terminal cleavage/methylation domain-containing protein